MRQVQAFTVDFIKQFEGLELETYKDSAGVNTIGYGHTGSAAYPGNKITEQGAESLLRTDIQEAKRALKFVYVPLDKYQEGALTSFIFNLGAGNFRDSTLLKKLNAKDYEGAANELPRWVHAGGQRLAGLVRRREAEKNLFLKKND